MSLHRNFVVPHQSDFVATASQQHRTWCKPAERNRSIWQQLGFCSKLGGGEAVVRPRRHRATSAYRAIKS